MDACGQTNGRVRRVRLLPSESESDYSPTGLNNLAQGKAQRRPGYASNPTPNALKGQNKQNIVDESIL